LDGYVHTLCKNRSFHIFFCPALMIGIISDNFWVHFICNEYFANIANESYVQLNHLHDFYQTQKDLDPSKIKYFSYRYMTNNTEYCKNKCMRNLWSITFAKITIKVKGTRWIHRLGERRCLQEALYSMIQKDGLTFVCLYFLNYTWYVNDLHNIWKRRS